LCAQRPRKIVARFNANNNYYHLILFPAADEREKTMKLNFLCDHHRASLRNERSAAATASTRAYVCALEILRQEQYVPVIHHAGSAVEAAEILLLGLEKPTARGINRYSEAAALPVHLLLGLGEKIAARTAIACADGTLQRLVARGLDRPTVLAGCERLMRLEDQARSSSTLRAWTGDLRMRMPCSQQH
jgi:hypothetical protein